MILPSQSRKGGRKSNIPSTNFSIRQITPDFLRMGIIIDSPSYRAVVAQRSRQRIRGGRDMSSSLVPLKTHHLRRRCTLKLKRPPAGVEARRVGAISRVVLVT
ncbi:hypothetical protein TNCV_4895651 [Trichonephila clavipes]|nr:hypothetical protein TNCV_4895651 [Trichonephila clavipes]